MSKKNMILRALRSAFPHTIPILAGFTFLGMTYGILITTEGFPFWFPILTSICVFAGSMEFAGVALLLGGFNPFQALAMTLMINARHLFYGISMLEKYKGMGWKKFYLIFGLCDESFSINCSVDVPEGVDKGWFMFFVTLLDQLYWVTGCTLGGIFGSFLTVNTEGLDFVMTAMFVVIFLEQWLKEKNHSSSLIGLAVPFVCLLIFGADRFIIPSMIALLGILALMRRPFEREVAEK
ncbi:MAG: AzlC family ABC transporter permease [Clostridia bacterium]|nr:AzlC family ABC transporter permease [Clostridia bacterium]